MKINRAWNIIKYFLLIGFLLIAGIAGYRLVDQIIREKEILKKVIMRLEADSRIAEILVTGVNYDEELKKSYTTIKFLEYGANGVILDPKYFTFSGNIIQFQSLVIRFDDIHIRQGDKLKGKSAYLFWKVFMLDGENTQEYEITKLSEIPLGYKLEHMNDPFEVKLWKDFWAYALNPDKSKSSGIKNAQIEAPGTMFVPGHIYTIKVEHDGGMRIDSYPISPILRGENIP